MSVTLVEGPSRATNNILLAAHDRLEEFAEELGYEFFVKNNGDQQVIFTVINGDVVVKELRFHPHWLLVQHFKNAKPLIKQQLRD